MVIDTGDDENNVLVIKLDVGGTFNWLTPPSDPTAYKTAILTKGKGTVIFDVAPGTDYEMGERQIIMPYNMAVEPGKNASNGRWTDWGQNFDDKKMIEYLVSLLGYDCGEECEDYHNQANDDCFGFMHYRTDLGNWDGSFNAKNYLKSDGDVQNFVPGPTGVSVSSGSSPYKIDTKGIQGNILIGSEDATFSFVYRSVFAGFLYAPESDYVFVDSDNEKGAFLGGMVVKSFAPNNMLPYFGVYPNEKIMKAFPNNSIPNPDAFTFSPRLTGR